MCESFHVLPSIPFPLNRFLATPVSRNALMNADVVQKGISTAAPSVVIVLLGRAAGADINTFLLLPLTFLSSSFMAPSQMPSWMRHIAGFNPVNWAMAAGRSALSADPDRSLVLSRGALLVLAAVAVWLSTRTFRSYQKSV